MRQIIVGPDAQRYLLAGQGKPVARPFHLRWLLPAVCRDSLRRWRWVWLASWPAAAGGMVVWGIASGLEWQRAAAAAVLVVGLSGVWGPPVVRPVGVDLPALALTVWSVALWEVGGTPAAVASGALLALAAATKESSPVFAAVWAWHPVFLVPLLSVAVIHLIAKPEVDEVTAHPHLREIHDHPVRTALAAREGMWRDGWVMVASWGACLLALYDPSPQVAVSVAVAYVQLLVATDTVRLLHTAAGPVLALAAVQVVPVEWLPLVCALHVVWFRPPEVV